MPEGNDDRIVQPVSAAAGAGEPRLARRMNLPLLVLYGLSVTVGAGIYVLIGEVAARAGPYTPFAFLGASLLVALSAASYAELSARFPVSAGEAAYVRAGLGVPTLALVVGLMVATAGIVSSAALLRGGAGYVQEFVTAPIWLIALSAGIAISAIAAWGISQSAWTAAILGVCEVGLLVVIIAFGLADSAPLDTALERLTDTPAPGQLAGISGAILVAFFAFIGFEDMVNVAEEVEDPVRTMPLAIAATLIITTMLYVSVAFVAIAHVPLAELSASSAPLTLLFAKLTGAASSSGHAVTLVAIAAVLNGVLVQLVMSSRVLYGLARMGQLPERLGRVDAATRTPLFATGLVVILVLTLSLFSETPALADLTSSLTLVIFAIVNLSLWRMKSSGQPDGEHYVTVPMWVPIAGFVVSLGFVAYEWASRFGLMTG
ncbi:MAG: APC family permease [Alphaproteobacteria bacterium]|nr:APC family permease [Alphaproteobacteria bacterium]